MVDRYEEQYLFGGPELLHYGMYLLRIQGINNPQQSRTRLGGFRPDHLLRICPGCRGHDDRPYWGKVLVRELTKLPDLFNHAGIHDQTTPTSA